MERKTLNITIRQDLKIIKDLLILSVDVERFAVTWSNQSDYCDVKYSPSSLLAVFATRELPLHRFLTPSTWFDLLTKLPRDEKLRC